MGNCECLRGEKDKNEINLTLRDNTNNDYEQTHKGKAKAVNNKFTVVDNDEDEHPPVKNSAIIFNDDLQKVQQEDDFAVTFTKKADIIEENDRIEKIVANASQRNEAKAPILDKSYVSDSDIDESKLFYIIIS